MQQTGRIRWLAVLAGFLLDQVVSLIISSIALGFDDNVLQGQFFSTPAGVTTGVLLGLSTIVGGWVAGRIVKDNRFVHGFLVGGLGIIALLLQSFSETAVTLDQIVLQFVATVLAGVAAHLSYRAPTRQRK